MKFSRLGICSRSDGTFGLSRVKCVLSNCTKITCWIWPWAELSWHVPAAEAVLIGAADTLIPKPANATATRGVSAAKLSSLRPIRRVTNPPPSSETGSHPGEEPASPDPDCPRSWGDVQHPRLAGSSRSEEHTSELQSRENLVCRLL